jgi:hypothetical protein
VLDTPEFRQGKVYTNFVEKMMQSDQ